MTMNNWYPDQDPQAVERAYRWALQRPQYLDWPEKEPPMKDTVTVNGIVLTRAQVESALKDLNMPTFRPGDLVREECFGLGIVTGGDMLQGLNTLFGDVEAGYRCISIHGCDSWWSSASSLVLIKKGPIA